MSAGSIPGNRSQIADVEGEIAALDGLARPDLRTLWRRLIRSEPPLRISRDLMVRAIAYRMQERARGGLGLAIRRRLRLLVEAPADNRITAGDRGVVLKPGASLVREWHGRTHTVLVREDGFDYQGQRYRSLTQIAQTITGAHWSGPIFFGVRKRPARPAGEAGHE
jgi:hypothetical protein